MSDTSKPAGLINSAPETKTEIGSKRDEAAEEAWEEKHSILSRDVSATFADTYFVTLNGDFIRVTVGEYLGEDIPAKYRLAFVMPAEDALALANTIRRIYADAKKGDSGG